MAVLPTPDLIGLLASPSKWTRQTALRLIGDRKEASLAPELRRMVESERGQLALEALWALNLVGGLDVATAMKTLEHPDPHVRLWTARLICDDARATPSFAAAMARRAAIEPAVEVRSQLACSAKRLLARDALPIVRALLARGEDAVDIHMPMLLWWAIESKAGTDPEAVLAMFEDRAIWNLPIARTTVLERLMRRFAAAGTRPDLDRCARLLAMAPGPDHVNRLMTGFEAAYAGRSLVGLPPDLVDAMARNSGQSLTIGLRQGKPEAVAEALHLLADARADRSRQLQLLQVLGEVRRPACLPVVIRLACDSSDNALRAAALAALAGYNDPAIPAEVLKAYPNMSDDVLASAQSLLVSRRAWAGQFLDVIEARTIDPQTVPREVVEKLLLLGDARIADRATRLFGPIRPSTSSELRAEIDRLAAVVGAGSGVPKPGKAIFDRHCAALPYPVRQGR